MVLHVIQCGKERDKQAREAAWEFMNKKLSVCMKNYPEIGEFPTPIQKLLAQELDAVEGRLEQGKPVPEFDESLICYCRYLLHSGFKLIKFYLLTRLRKQVCTSLSPSLPSYIPFRYGIQSPHIRRLGRIYTHV